MLCFHLCMNGVTLLLLYQENTDDISDATYDIDEIFSSREMTFLCTFFTIDNKS